MISIIDYGAGNILSVKKALDFLGIDSVLTDKKSDIERSDALILPGVGAFPDAMECLKNTGLVDIIKTQAKLKPFLGICLGMQLLFEKSYEFSECEGLSLISGIVTKIEGKDIKIPHMGWNDLKIINNCPLLKGINDGDYVYFVHSFKAETDDENINCYTTHGQKIPALVSNGSIYGAQFHPEKSSETGLKILKNFCNLIKP